MPNEYQPSPWMAWIALGLVAIIFAIFFFYHESTKSTGSVRTGSSKTLRQRYLKHIIDSYQFLEFKGIVQFEKLPLRMSLEKVYVNLWAQPETPSAESINTELRLAGRKLIANEMAFDDDLELLAERARPVQVEEALREHPALVLLGDPGSGKSTLLKHLALNSAINFEQVKRLPILLPLAAYAHALKTRQQLSLREFLPEFYNGLQEFPENPAPLFYEALQNGAALVLLDGLDEVTNPEERSHVVHHVKNFYLNYCNTVRTLPASRRVENKFVITSRIVGYREAPLEAMGITHLTVLDFNKAQIEQFAQNWCRTYEIAHSGDTPKAHRDAEQEEKRLLRSIFGNSGVEKLAAKTSSLPVPRSKTLAARVLAKNAGMK